MSRKWIPVFAGMTLLVAGHLHAAEAAPAAEDPVVESRVSALAAELRCLVCQNQSIAESSAPLAVDLRNEIREKIRKGESEKEILNFMTERYGDFVLYRPPLRVTTVVLWSGPLLLLLGGFFVLYRRLKAPVQREAPELSAADRARAEKMLAARDEERA